MAGRSNGGRRSDRDSDSMEVLKPLVVLSLFGMILYGAYSVVQKGSTPAASPAPAFAPPDVQIAAPPPVATPMAAPAAAAAPLAVPAPAPANDPLTTYLPADSAPPPSPGQLVPRPTGGPAPADRPAAYPAQSTPAAPAMLPAEPQATLVDRAADAVPPPAASTVGASSAAFASAWADAHDKLAAGRYAEALAALSVWYDDPSLGLEESHRLEDLLGQLAGTVIYSQQDLLLPPRVVAPGETLDIVAGPLGISPRLLAKINGVEDPQRLVPGEHLKVIRGPFDAVVSVSRRRISLQLNGAYAGSFPVVVGRRYLEKIGASLPVLEMQHGAGGATTIPAGTASLRKAIVLGEGLVIEGVDDPVAVADAAPQTSLVMSARDLEEILDILGPASRILVRQ
jgi:hypothetical protein